MPTSLPRTSATGAVLVLVDFPSDIGFAIQHLIGAFHAMGERLTGDPDRVHFAFQALTKHPPALPAGFRNLVAFSTRDHSRADVEALAEYVRRHGIDTVFALDLKVEADFLGRLRSCGVHRIISYWGAPMSSPNTGLRLVAKRVEVTMRRARPDLFIFESEAMRRLATGGRGIPVGETAVVPTGVDLARFEGEPPAPGAVHARFGIPSDRRLILFVGHLHERKGVATLLRASGVIERRGRAADVHVLFLGSRPGEEEAFAKDLPNDRSLITIGGYHSDIAALMRGAYVGCIPSTGWDSFPMSALEMQACGLPVVVSDLQGTPETIENGVSGIVTRAGDPEALADALLTVVDDPGLRSRLSAGAVRRIRSRFTREHWIQGLVDAVRGTRL